LFADRGSVLIVTLWSASILSIALASLSFQAGAQKKLAGVERREFEGHWALVSGLNLAVRAVAEDPDPYCDSLSDVWRGNLGLGPAWEEKLAVSVEDEDAKINLNLASEGLLEALLKRLSVTGAKTLSKKIIEYREKKKRRRLEFLEEILFADEMTGKDFRAIEPYVTVASDENVYPAVNVNTAGSVVLGAVIDSLPGDAFAKKDLARRLAEFRGGPFVPQELEPAIFMEKLGLAPGPQMAGVVNRLLLYLKADSTAFQARIKAPGFSKSARAIFKCRTEACRPEILEWRED
jgi:type II secretory pathway component PulK